VVGIASPGELVEILGAVSVAVDAVGAHANQRVGQRRDVAPADQPARDHGLRKGGIGGPYRRAGRVMTEAAAWSWSRSEAEVGLERVEVARGCERAAGGDDDRDGDQDARGG